MTATVSRRVDNPGTADQPAVVALVNNVSVEAFRLVPPPFPSILRAEAPSTTWRQSQAGAVDLAVISVAVTPEVTPWMEPIGDFGVACSGAVGSVLLFSRHAVGDLLRQGRPIHLTAESETSRRLLRLLCLHEFGIEPVVTHDPEEAEGRLCIGDDALRRRRDPHGSPVTVDLGAWWHARTGLPFVFARWMVRRSAPAAFKQAARTWLGACVEAAVSTEGRQAMVHRGLQAGLFDDAQAAHHYFESLRSRLTVDDVVGERLFLEWLGNAGTAVHLP